MDAAPGQRCHGVLDGTDADVTVVAEHGAHPGIADPVEASRHLDAEVGATKYDAVVRGRRIQRDMHLAPAMHADPDALDGGGEGALRAKAITGHQRAGRLQADCVWQAIHSLGLSLGRVGPNR